MLPAKSRTCWWWAKGYADKSQEVYGEARPPRGAVRLQDIFEIFLNIDILLKAKEHVNVGIDGNSGRENAIFTPDR